MNAIILAAGQGNRLRPYSLHKPKCMVSLAGRPLLHWQLGCLNASGLTSSIVVVGGYHIAGLTAPGATIVENTAYASTNMVHSLMCARAHIVLGEDLLISYGDIVYEPRVLRAVVDSPAPLTIAADHQWRRCWSIRMENPLADAETFKLAADGRITELGRKPKSYDEVQGQYMGLVKFRGDRVVTLLEHIDRMDRSAKYDGKDFSNMYMTSLLQNLIDAGWAAHACLVDNGWLEVDTASELDEFHRMHDDGSLKSFCDLSSIV